MKVTARPPEPTWWATAGFVAATATVSWGVADSCPFHPGRKALPRGILCGPCQTELEERDPPLKGLPVKRKRTR